MPIIILLCISNMLADKMGQLLTYISTSVSGLWQWMTDDYWIDLDEKIEYIVDAKTGQVIGTKNGAKEVTWNPWTGVTFGGTQDQDELPEGSKIEEYTLIDKYIRDLGDLGFSIKDLRLLGDGADYSNMNKLLEDKDNKRLVEKYIAEFVRADIITQEFHKRRGTELVAETHQNLVDGGIYLYRTKKEETITENQFVNGNYEAENVEVKDKDFKQMEYIDIDKFHEMVAKNDKNVRYKFSVDRQTGELLVAKMTSTQVVEEDVSNTVNKWFADLAQWLSKFDLAGTSTYEMEEVRIPYKEYISKYTMPYEFLINLCEWTQNPEFAYHVALLARDTKIVLVIQDDTTIERETIETEEDRKYYRNDSGPQTEGATVSDATPKTVKKRKTTTVTTQTPVLRIEYADTWSFYEEFEYTKNIKGTLEEEGPIVEKPEIPSTLSGYQPETKGISYDPADGAYEGAGVEVTKPEYWYDTFVTERRIKTQMITTTTTYNEPILKNSVEKSKQFLGLLQNDDGECPYDCFEEYAWSRQNPMALSCSKKAVFNRKGVFVQYKIPNMERWESPYSRLICAIELTYSSMQLEKDEEEDTEDYEAQLDYESMYNQKMQGLVEHLQYLMTFPENESYTPKDLILDTIWDDDDDDDDDDIIVDEGTIASAREIYEFLIGKGFTPESACAILGNMQQESSFNTGASNGTHFGLCQWGGGRWIRLKEFAKQRGTSWTDLNTQLEYLWYELCGAYSNVKNRIINSTDMKDATDIFCRKFEVCGNYGIEVPGRYKYAKYWYNLFVGLGDSNNTDLQNALLRILSNLSSYNGIENGDGYCQRFVRTVFEKIGIQANAGSASSAERQWKVSTDMNHIPVGATVYGRGSSADGHVGIYIGNGMVVHNIGRSHNCSYGGLKGIKCESISSWNSKYRFTSWGWQGGRDLRR